MALGLVRLLKSSKMELSCFKNNYSIPEIKKVEYKIVLKMQTRSGHAFLHNLTIKFWSFRKMKRKFAKKFNDRFISALKIFFEVLSGRTTFFYVKKNNKKIYFLIPNNTEKAFVLAISSSFYTQKSFTKQPLHHKFQIFQNKY